MGRRTVPTSVPTSMQPRGVGPKGSPQLPERTMFVPGVLALVCLSAKAMVTEVKAMETHAASLLNEVGRSAVLRSGARSASERFAWSGRLHRGVETAAAARRDSGGQSALRNLRGGVPV